ncbi:hypothetical protein K3G63_09600 [Hymenobacter sp. HSC-4F20]|uniref:hypothetical protein n=1 Tax=Hymenobacter sp. HSC-4F20 TaxID=2864135 RepID=UPI001C73AC93|nr:hypothetical protein [Hymenobacter sp. HSC-4F20]MBX0290692.1 hypothetical protein [Hymenobacter sp. HSC-4F20]
MRKHHGMRPQDVVLLLKISLLEKLNWQGKALAAALGLSPAEVSDALRRCQFARLLHPEHRTINRPRLLRFLVHGLPCVFPVELGPHQQGLPILLPKQGGLATPETYVWPTADGPAWGATIEPLYPGAVLAARQDPALHELLTLTEVLRLDNPVLRTSAKQQLQERLLVSEAG